MLHGNKGTLHEMVSIGFYSVIITALIWGAVAILKSVAPFVPITPYF